MRVNRRIQEEMKFIFIKLNFKIKRRNFEIKKKKTAENCRGLTISLIFCVLNLIMGMEN